MGNNIISITSKLYDYSVEFIDDFQNTIAAFEDTCVYVIDKNVYELYQKKFTVLERDRIYLMDAVESNKNMDTVMDIISFMRGLSVKKNWRVICFGGGITQDVTTIVSDLFLRNVEWYFFPTTLLSMCDSCIGGKCGINLGEYKNQIGVFYPPKKIFIDIRFINTLIEGDYINGWGELLKFSLTSDETFYETLKKEAQFVPCKNIRSYIFQGLETKKQVIEADEFESDLRRILNYGHTFGHALEAYTHNEVPHGKGVIWGIDVANYLAWRKGLISKEYYYEIKSLIRRAFLPDELTIGHPNELFEIIKTDKKVRGDVLNFAFLDGRSHLGVYPVKIDGELKGLFMDYIADTHDYYNN